MDIISSLRPLLVTIIIHHFALAIAVCIPASTVHNDILLGEDGDIHQKIVKRSPYYVVRIILISLGSK